MTPNVPPEAKRKRKRKGLDLFQESAMDTMYPLMEMLADQDRRLSEIEIAIEKLLARKPNP
jgi:hypothetical protein